MVQPVISGDWPSASVYVAPSVPVAGPVMGAKLMLASGTNPGAGGALLWPLVSHGVKTVEPGPVIESPCESTLSVLLAAVGPLALFHQLFEASTVMLDSLSRPAVALPEIELSLTGRVAAESATELST